MNFDLFNVLSGWSTYRSVGFLFVFAGVISFFSIIAGISVSHSMVVEAEKDLAVFEYQLEQATIAEEAASARVEELEAEMRKMVADEVAAVRLKHRITQTFIRCHPDYPGN